MKLIIEIDEETYEICKAWANTATVFSEETKAIANGIPYEVRPQGEWIPVSERLPEDETEVLFQYQYGKSMMVGYHKFDTTIYPFGYEDENETGWYDRIDDFICGDDEVIAWMPLPEAYKEAENEP